MMGGFSTAEKYNGNLSPVFIRTITQITKGTIEPDVMEFYLKGGEKIKMKRSGFSLVEILIVAGVLSVLAVVFTA
jgi:prepilin-type N-terminal cleavage/methylation domain-containing protein